MASCVPGFRETIYPVRRRKQEAEKKKALCESLVDFASCLLFRSNMLFRKLVCVKGLSLIVSVDVPMCETVNQLLVVGKPSWWYYIFKIVCSTSGETISIVLRRPGKSWTRWEPTEKKKTSPQWKDWQVSNATKPEIFQKSQKGWYYICLVGKLCNSLPLDVVLNISLLDKFSARKFLLGYLIPIQCFSFFLFL